jgi:hypothetical protein
MYVPQDVRVVSIRPSLVAGYITERWKPGLPTPSTRTYGLADCVAQFRNQGTATAVIKLQETDDDSPSGARTSLVAVAVTPGGEASVAFTPKRKFFEVKAISAPAGTGPVSIEISTKIDFSRVGFNYKLDSNFPAIEWADNINLTTAQLPAKSASQTFTSNTSWAVTHNLGFVADFALIDSTGVDITSLATISAVTTNGFTATFGSAKVGTAYSSR